MAEALYAKDFADVVLYVKENFISGKKIIDLSPALRRFTVTMDLENPTLYDHGEDTFSYSLQTGSYSNFQLDQLFGEDSWTQGNLGAKGTAYWAMMKTAVAFDQRQCGYGSRSANQVVDLIKMHYRNMWNDWYKNQERYKWTLAAAPNNGSSGRIRPNGIPNYVVASATAAVGKNGGDPSGYTSGQDGLLRSSEARYKNWTATWADAVDLQKKVDEMIDKLEWNPPWTGGDEINPAQDYMIASHYEPYRQYKDFLTTANDNLGSDAGRYRGPIQKNQLVFRGVPWIWVPALTESTYEDGSANPSVDSNQPVYLLDASTWEIAAARGWYKKMDGKPVVQDNPHNTVVDHMDCIYQRICIRPSGNGVIQKA